TISKRDWSSDVCSSDLKAIDLSNAGYSRHFKFLKQARVPHFELGQQRRIASLLDEADAIRTKRRAQLAHLDELPQVLFHGMFGEIGRASCRERGGRSGG